MNQILKFFKKFLSFLGKRGVKDEILNFNPRTIAPENREGVEKLLKKNADSFDLEVKTLKFNDLISII